MRKKKILSFVKDGVTRSKTYVGLTTWSEKNSGTLSSTMKQEITYLLQHGTWTEVLGTCS